MAVVPYLPKLLELTKMKMEAATIVGGGGMMSSSQSEVPLDHSLEALVVSKDSWKEVSILEFINTVSPQKVCTLRSQIYVDVKARNSKILSWRPENATDEEAGEEVYKSVDRKLMMDKEFVRQDSPRKSYELRPAAVSVMKYGQFACQYRQLHRSQIGHDKAYEECSNSNTLVGPDSDIQMVGVQGKAAPTSMLLKNGAVMKLREDKVAVPLLPSDEMNYVTDVLLFGEWQTSDEVTEEAEVNDTPLKEEQRRSARKELFPKMVYK